MTTQIENQKHKDTVYRMLYNDKSRQLELYNALNGSHYTNVDDLTVTTLEGETFLNMKNDVSFIFNDELSLFEHQSTACPNIPLRDLFYVSSIYRDITDINDTYTSKRMKIPTPRFIVFYNGTSPMGDQRVYRLSDMFVHKMDDPELELVVRVININEGHNTDLMESCKTLKQYSIFVGKVRKYIEEGRKDYCTKHAEIDDILSIDNEDRKNIIRTAVTKAIDDCIENDILKEFFEQYRKEVINVGVIEYSAERHLQAVKSEGYDEGLDAGIQIGVTQGLDTGIIGAVAIMRGLNLSDDSIIEKICQQYGLTTDQAKKYL